MSRHITALTLTVALLLAAGCTQGGDARDEADPPATSGAAGSSPSVDAATNEEAALTGLWTDVTEKSLGTTAEWSNKVELADLDDDGDVDLLFANGGDYETPGTPVRSQAFLNRGDATFEEATDRVFGKVRAIARVLKVVDVDADGDGDVLMGTTFQTRSRLFLADGPRWREAPASQLPLGRLSIGDLEAGDVDGDSDLDLVLADWGPGSPMTNRGARTRLWLNDGDGHFSDATQAQMPRTLVRFSWELELVDVDNDWDLDVAVSCKTCRTSLLYENDGKGRFADVTDGRMPTTTNNYDFAPIDLDADGYLDLVTINDGETSSYGFPEHVFRNADGSFEDMTSDWWPPAENEGWDDNIAVALDVESDGDADFVVGSLDGLDRLAVNDGSGRLTVADEVFDAAPSQGTLGMAIADLDGDGRPDVVESQGEVEGYEDERVYLGTDALAPDTAAPVVVAQRKGAEVVARVHDNRTPNLPHDWRQIAVGWDGGDRDMTWYGENLFVAKVPRDAVEVEVCATDVAGNETCARAEGD